MKTSKTELNFEKYTLLELNETQLLEVEGGTTSVCVGLFMGGVALGFDISLQIF